MAQKNPYAGLKRLGINPGDVEWQEIPFEPNGTVAEWEAQAPPVSESDVEWEPLPDPDIQFVRDVTSTASPPVSDIIRRGLRVGLGALGARARVTEPGEAEEGEEIGKVLATGLGRGLTSLAELAGTGLQYTGEATRPEELPETALEKYSPAGALQRVRGAAGEAMFDVGQDISQAAQEFRKQHLTIPEYHQDLLEHPEQLASAGYWIYNLAEQAVNFGAMAAGGWGSAAASRALGAALKLGPKGVQRAITIGRRIGAGTVAGTLEATQTYQETLTETGDPQQAARDFEAMTLLAGTLNALGFEKTLGVAGKALKSKVVKTLGAGAWESLTEYAEEPAEVVAKLWGHYLKTGELPEGIGDMFIAALREGINVLPVSFVIGSGVNTMAQLAEQSGVEPEQAQRAITDNRPLADRIQEMELEGLSLGEIALELQREAEGEGPFAREAEKALDNMVRLLREGPPEDADKTPPEQWWKARPEEEVPPEPEREEIDRAAEAGERALEEERPVAKAKPEPKPKAPVEAPMEAEPGTVLEDMNIRYEGPWLEGLHMWTSREPGKETTFTTESMVPSEIRQARDEALAAFEPVAEPVPEPKAAGAVEPEELINGTTFEQFEDLVMTGTVDDISRELDRIVETRGVSALQDRVAPGKVGSRLYKRLVEQGMDKDRARESVEDVLPEYEMVYNMALEDARIAQGAEAAFKPRVEAATEELSIPEARMPPTPGSIEPSELPSHLSSASMIEGEVPAEDLDISRAARLLQERTRLRAEAAGVDLSEDVPETREVISDTIAGEVEAAVKSGRADKAGRWYKDAVGKAVEKWSERFPEIKDDPDADFALRMAMAVTSNGSDPIANVKAADRAYSRFRETGRFPTDYGVGTASGVQKKSFEFINRLKDTIGADNMRRFLTENWTVRELRTMGMPVLGEIVEAERPGSSVLGPKIGGGFLPNLLGDLDQVTIDRWAMRTWGRLTGTLTPARPKAIENQRARLRQAAKRSPKRVRKLGFDPGAVQSKDETADNFARAAYREFVNSGYKDAKNTVNRAARVLVSNIDSTRLVPDSPSERSRIRSAFQEASRKLRERGYEDLDPATTQAVLWYNEKDLYNKLTGGRYGRTEPIDYAEAFDRANLPSVSAGLERRPAPGEVQQEPERDVGRGREEGRRPGGGAVQEAVPEYPSEFTPAQRRAYRDLGPGEFEEWRKHFLRKNIVFELDRRLAERSPAGVPRPFRSGTEGISGRPVTHARALRGREGLQVYRYEPERLVVNALAVGGVDASPVIELADPRGAEVFHEAISEAKSEFAYGPAVEVKSVDDYRSLRLFTTEDGSAGFALQGDEIISVFKSRKSPHDNASLPLLMLAKQEGGRRLDCFDTVLPYLYSMAGFTVESRLPFADEAAPDDWDYEAFSRYNNGRPDVLFMNHYPGYWEFYDGTQGERFEDYDEAVTAAASALQAFDRAQDGYKNTQTRAIVSSWINSGTADPGVAYDGAVVSEMEQLKLNLGAVADPPPKAGPGQKVVVQQTGNVKAASVRVSDVAEAASLMAQIRKSPQELAYTVAVDEMGRILEIHKYSKGTATRAYVSPQELVGRALNLPDVKKVYFVHNHPAETLKPSPQDLQLAKELKWLLGSKLVSLENIIIAGTKYAVFDPVTGKYTENDIPPALRVVSVPVKERARLQKTTEFKAREAVTTAGESVQALNVFSSGQSGALLLDTQLRPVTFVPFEKGKTKAETTAEFLRQLESTGSTQMVFQVNEEDPRAAERLDYAKAVYASGLGGADVLDIVSLLEGRKPKALSLTGELPPKVRPPKFRDFINEARLAAAEEPFRVLKRQAERMRIMHGEIMQSLRATAGASEEILSKVDLQLRPTVEIPSNYSTERSFEEWAQRGVKVRQLLGATLFDNHRAVVQLSLHENFETIRREAFHEYFHVLNSMVLPRRDVERLQKYYKGIGGEEAAADEFRDFCVSRERTTHGRPSWIVGIWRKLKAFAERLRNALRGRGFFRPADVFGPAVAGQYARPRVGALIPTRAGTGTLSFSAEPEAVPWGYSELASVVWQGVQSREMPAKAQSIPKWLRKKGVKPTETKWMDVDGWLRDNVDSKGRIDRDAFMNFVLGNQVRFDEVMKGDDSFAEAVRTAAERLHEGSIPSALDLDSCWREEAGNVWFFDPDAFFASVALPRAAREREIQLGAYFDLRIELEGDNELVAYDGRQFLLALSLDPDEALDPTASVHELASSFEVENAIGAGLEYLTETFGGDLTYARYTLPGGETSNYRELLITFPHGDDAYTSPHWEGVPNVLAHARLTDRMEAGNKESVLFIEEVQSDWLQEAAVVGMKPLDQEAMDARKQELSDEYEAAREEHKRIRDAIQKAAAESENVKALLRRRAPRQGVPGAAEEERRTAERLLKEHADNDRRLRRLYYTLADLGAPTPRAPLMDTWHEFVLKRLIRTAAEEGFDRVAWTAGQHQEERYPTHEIGEITVKRLNESEAEIEAKTADGRPIHSRRFPIGTKTGLKELARTVGKRLAERVNKDAQGLEVGGTTTYEGLGEKPFAGVTKFYDEKIPGFLKKYLKKWNAWLEEFDVVLDNVDNTTRVPGFRVTPEMRRAALYEGQAFFSPRRETDETTSGGGNDGDTTGGTGIPPGTFDVDPVPLEMPEVVELARLLMGGRLPQVRRKIIRSTAHGLFTPRDGGLIKLRADIFQDMDEALKILNHEIGHLVDWLPDKYLSRGNILGRIATLKRYMKGSLPHAVPVKLSDADRQRLRDLAKRLVKEENPEEWVDREITRELPISPEDVLAIWNSAEASIREQNPDLYNYIAKLGATQKKFIIKEALKGSVPEDLKRFSKIIRTGKTVRELHRLTPEEFEAAARKRYEELIHQEIEKNRHFHRNEIVDELKSLSRMWKPFDPAADPKYTSYRYSGKELYADAWSVFLANPGLLKEKAPRFYQAFTEYMYRKPGAYVAYRDLIGDIRSFREGDKLSRKIHASFDEADEKYGQYINQDERLRDQAMRDFIDKFWIIQRDVNRVGAASIPPKENPVYKIEEMVYVGSETEDYVTAIHRDVHQILERAGLEWNREFGELLFYMRVHGEQAVEGETKAAPFGITPDIARREIAKLRRRLTEGQWDALRKAVANFRRLREKHVIPKVEAARMHDPKLLKAMKDTTTYVTFDVVKHIDARYGRGPGARIYPRYGTFEGIANVATATIVKDMALLKAAKRNIAARTVVEFYLSHKDQFPDAVRKAETRWNGRTQQPREPADPQRGLLVYLEDGKPRGYYVDTFLADALDSRNKMMEHALWGLTARIFRRLSAPFRTIFTELNYGFWMFNTHRDYFRAVTNLPKASVTNFTKHYIKGIKPAYRSVFGIPDETIEQMRQGNMLISLADPRGMNPEDSMWERQLRQWHLMPRRWKYNVLRPIGGFFTYMSNIGKAVERTPKVAGFTYIKKNFPDLPDEVVGHLVRIQAGSPDFLRQGRAAPLYNNFLLFSNAMKEGYRGDFEAMQESPREWWMKRVKYVFLPKLLQYTATAGLLDMAYDWIWSPDDDDEQDVKQGRAFLIARIMRGVSVYDATNYHIIPLGLTADGRSVYLRVPVDEGGRLLGGIFWKLLNWAVPDDLLEEFGLVKGKTLGEHMSTELLDYMAGQAPTVTPGIGVMHDALLYLTGQNPYDTFYGRHAMTELEYQAGGKYAREAMFRHLANKLGTGIVYRFQGSDVETVIPELDETVFPFSKTVLNNLVKVSDKPVLSNTLGRFLKVTNYGVREELRADALEVRSKNAQDILEARQSLAKITMGEPLEQEDLQNIARKPGLVDSTVARQMARRYGNVFMQSYLSAQSTEERAAILQKAMEIQALEP